MNKITYNLKKDKIRKITVGTTHSTIICAPDNIDIDYLEWDKDTMTVVGFKEREPVLQVFHVDKICVERC